MLMTAVYLSGRKLRHVGPRSCLSGDYEGLSALYPGVLRRKGAHRMKVFSKVLDVEASDRVGEKRNF